ncbi:transposase IS66-like protein [Janthinobacterium sp. 13]|nr:transposase IS66-like protein [Janthinobacterium sp. 13]
MSLTCIAAVCFSGIHFVRRSYSLIGTAKLNGIDPEAWLRHVLAHIGDHPVNRVDEFPPWHFLRHSNAA